MNDVIKFTSGRLRHLDLDFSILLKNIIFRAIDENNTNIANLFKTYQSIQLSMYLLLYVLSFDSLVTQFFYAIYMIIMIYILVPVTQYLVQTQSIYVKKITTFLIYKMKSTRWY